MVREWDQAAQVEDKVLSWEQIVERGHQMDTL